MALATKTVKTSIEFGNHRVVVATSAGEGRGTLSVERARTGTATCRIECRDARCWDVLAAAAKVVADELREEDLDGVDVR